MSCVWQNKVALYVDDELDARARQEFSTHLAGCRECAAAVNVQTEFKKALRVAGKRFYAPPDLHAAVYRSIKPEKTVSPWWKWALAPLCLMLLGVIGFLLYPRPERNPMMAGLVDQHITNLALSSEHQVEVVSSDRHTVKPWYQGRLPFTFDLPDLPQGGQLQLIGGKVVYQGQQPGAELWYQAGPHKISVFIFQARRGETSSGFNRDLNFNVDSWVQGGLQYYLVTDGSREEAGKLVNLLQEANHR
jgi:anti-sigma factor RsiW